jgi:hypothetical protein
MKSPVFDFKSINRKLNRLEQKAEYDSKNPPVPDTSMYGWPYGVASPVVSVALVEGGEWIPVKDAPDNVLAHAVKYADGSVWDEINGRRNVKI